jgi:hypothetical protein
VVELEETKQLVLVEEEELQVQVTLPMVLPMPQQILDQVVVESEITKVIDILEVVVLVL